MYFYVLVSRLRVTLRRMSKSVILFWWDFLMLILECMYITAQYCTCTFYGTDLSDFDPSRSVRPSPNPCDVLLLSLALDETWKVSQNMPNIDFLAVICCFQVIWSKQFKGFEGLVGHLSILLWYFRKGPWHIIGFSEEQSGIHPPNLSILHKAIWFL